MATVAVLTNEVHEAEGTIADGRAVVAESDLERLTGWELKPEGLCRGEVCVPVADQAQLRPPSTDASAGMVDLVGVATALGRTALVDADLGAVAISEASTDRDSVVSGMTAPVLELDDLNGNRVSTAAFKGKKKLLVVFASW